VRLQRIYADTSVIGGCLDDEFRDASVSLMNLFREKKAVLVLSDLTLRELEGAPKAVRGIVDSLPPQAIELIQLSADAVELASQYIRRQVVKEEHLIDAEHIAVATLAAVDVLVSWNFKHIVSLPRIRGYNSINLLLGHPQLEIRTPREVLPHEERDADEDF